MKNKQRSWLPHLLSLVVIWGSTALITVIPAFFSGLYIGDGMVHFFSPDILHPGDFGFAAGFFSASGAILASLGFAAWHERATVAVEEGRRKGEPSVLKGLLVVLLISAACGLAYSAMALPYEEVPRGG